MARKLDLVFAELKGAWVNRRVVSNKYWRAEENSNINRLWQGRTSDSDCALRELLMRRDIDDDSGMLGMGIGELELKSADHL